ncbi:hypothetical protein [Leptospira alstonii]|uniref:hypothetical protein n=1 Tax=Leptospira alstonii TaxID=28452 RepID=UPI0018DED815|nr:hypothetical protein [Leptospira alstonii]
MIPFGFPDSSDIHDLKDIQKGLFKGRFLVLIGLSKTYGFKNEHNLNYNRSVVLEDLTLWVRSKNENERFFMCSDFLINSRTPFQNFVLFLKDF